MEPPIGFFDRVKRFADRFPERVDEYEDLLTGNPIWQRRIKGVGLLSPEDAIALGASGPTLRASGIDFDLRRDMPYSGYENFQFNVPVGTGCDVWTRYVLRVQEPGPGLGRTGGRAIRRLQGRGRSGRGNPGRRPGR